MIFRMYAQYADKPKAVAWYNIIPTIASELETAYTDITASWDIDINVQAQLDVIGRIVQIVQPWDTVQDDDIFRALLKSKIAKNNSDATIDSIIASMSFIIDGNTITVSDFEDMSFDVQFIEPLTAQQIDLLLNFDLVPKPQGVRFRGFAVIPNITLWGNDDAYFGGGSSQFGFYFGGN
jgi:hypothetical protein